MTHFRLVTPLVSLVIAGGFALLGGACSTAGTDGDPSEPGDEHVGSANEALTEEQCLYFDVNGTNTICHRTKSTNHPYTIVKTSVEACINGHAGHAQDYIAVGDPTCQGGGCLPTGAPCDATLPCCSGSTCEAGTCVLTCVPTTCEAQGATCGLLADGCGDTLDCGSCAAPESCGGGGTPNTCGCTPTTCAAQGATCGSIADGCGGTLDCGSCAAGSTCEGGTCVPDAPACPCEALPGWLDFVVSGTECINYSGSATSVYLYLKDTNSSRGIAVSTAIDFDEQPALCGVVGPNNVGNAFIMNITEDQVNACVLSLSQISTAGGVPCP